MGFLSARCPSTRNSSGFSSSRPWSGPAYRDDNPRGNMRKILFGPKGEGIAVYLVLEHERRVVVLSVTWLD